MVVSRINYYKNISTPRHPTWFPYYRSTAFPTQIFRDLLPCANGRPREPDKLHRCKSDTPGVALLRRDQRDAELAGCLGARLIDCEDIGGPGGNAAKKCVAGATTIDKRSEHRLIIRSSVAALRGWQHSRGLGGNIPVDCMATFPWTGWQKSVEYTRVHVDSTSASAYATVSEGGSSSLATARIIARTCHRSK